MKIGFIILCRYNSTRLPGKILKEINGKPIIQYIVDSLLNITSTGNIVVATSDQKSDNPISDYCNKNNIQVYRGDLLNVSKRFKDCANEYEFDFVTRINGDNIFIDQSTIIEMVHIVETNKYDFVSNVKNRTFPKGMSIEMVRVSYYNSTYQNFYNNAHFEHVTIYLYQHDVDQRYYYFYNKKCKEAAGMQFAIDTKQDFINAAAIISYLNKSNNFELEEVFNTYKKLNE